MPFSKSLLTRNREGNGMWTIAEKTTLRCVAAIAFGCSALLTGCTHFARPCNEDATLERITKQAPSASSIDDLSKEDQRLIRRVLHARFARQNRTEFLFSASDVDFSPQVASAFFRIAGLCKGKGVAYVLDLCGKPATAFSTNTGELVLVYRVGVTKTIDLCFAQGKLATVSGSEMLAPWRLVVGAADGLWGKEMHAKLRCILDAVAQGHVRNVDQLSEDKREALRKVFNAYSEGMAQSANDERISFDKDIENGFIQMATVCRGKSVDFLFDLFGSPLLVTARPDLRIGLVYKIGPASFLDLECDGKGKLVTISTRDKVEGSGNELRKADTAAQERARLPECSAEGKGDRAGSVVAE